MLTKCLRSSRWYGGTIVAWEGVGRTRVVPDLIPGWVPAVMDEEALAWLKAGPTVGVGAGRCPF